MIVYKTSAQVIYVTEKSIVAMILYLQNFCYNQVSYFLEANRLTEG